jgi:tetratricopeptide (TPR) repeat protein
MGQYQKAIETCQAGIKVTPWSEHYCQTADAYIHLKKYQEAVKACDSNHPRSLRKEALAAMGQK